MRYCKHGTCLCVEFKAQNIRVDANVCQCDHPLSEHNMTGTADESTLRAADLTEAEIVRLPAAQSVEILERLSSVQLEELERHGTTRLSSDQRHR